MINFFKETEVEIENVSELKLWLNQVAQSEEKSIGEINYIFCDDEYLLNINQQYLNHDTYTDIISFDSSEGKDLSGDIFISAERVADNAKIYQVDFIEEFRRVMVHGLLHFTGYKDKTEEESTLMRNKEDEKLKMFHVEQ